MIRRRSIWPLALVGMFALSFVTAAVADTLQTFQVWPGSQTKNGYFYTYDNCLGGYSYYNFYQPVDVYGYSTSVDLNVLHTRYGGQDGSTPKAYTSWAAYDTYGHWTGTAITPLGYYTVGSYNLDFYPYLNAQFTSSRPAYTQVVVSDAYVSVGCRWTNYNQLIPY
jgi:hypothetical protein